jgi:PAS domain S-box-containing protein
MLAPHDSTLEAACGIGSYEWWPAEDRLVWSPRLIRIYGLNRAPTAEEGFSRLVHPDDRVRVEAETSAHLGSDAESFSHSFRIVRPDGSIRLILDRGTIERDEKGVVRVIRGLNFDLTDDLYLDERTRAVSALRESEERYRSLFENMLDGFAYCEMLFDDKGRPDDFIYLAVNDAFGRLTGLKDVIGKRVTQVIPGVKELAPELFEAYGRVASTGNAERFEIDFKPLGLFLSISVYCPVKGCFVAVFDNITERRQAEAALGESEARLRAVLDGSLDAIFMKDRDGRMVLANPATCAAVGKPAEAILGKTDEQFLDDPADARIIMANDRRIMLSGEPETVEEAVSTPSGTRYYLNKKVPRRDVAGNVIGLISTARDVTEQKRAEAALRESERRLTRELVDTKHLQNLSSLLIEKGDAEGLYEQIMETAMAVMRADFCSIQILDEEHDQLSLLAWKNFHPDAAKFWRTVSAGNGETCGAALQHGERIVVPDVRAAAFLQGSESQKYWALSGIVAFQSTPLTTREGRMLGMISTHWREVHTADERELRLFDILARQAADYIERGRAEAALRESKKRLQVVLGEVNHRAKNMLAVVQSIARQTVAASSQEFLERFSERVQALATNQDLLVKADWKGVKLDKLVRKQLAHFQDLIGSRIELNGPPLLISASAAQTLGMAIHELSTNAGKYGALVLDQGRIAIGWGLERDGAGGETFTMSWHEQGGPPVSPPTRYGFGSTVICALAESNLDAKVDLDFLATGLNWRLRCKAAGVIEGTRSPPAAEVRSKLNVPSSSRPKVLVVEDDALVAMEIAHVLKKAGFDLLGPARAVAQALSLIEENGCDAAVLDINLGGETSEPVARKLWANGTRFVTLSGYSRGQHPPVLDGATALAKPIQPALLIAEIKRCLASKENRQGQLPG